MRIIFDDYAKLLETYIEDYPVKTHPTLKKAKIHNNVRTNEYEVWYELEDVYLLPSTTQHKQTGFKSPAAAKNFISKLKQTAKKYSIRNFHTTIKYHPHPRPGFYVVIQTTTSPINHEIGPFELWDDLREFTEELERTGQITADQIPDNLRQHPKEAQDQVHTQSPDTGSW